MLSLAGLVGSWNQAFTSLNTKKGWGTEKGLAVLKGGGRVHKMLLCSFNVEHFKY